MKKTLLLFFLSIFTGIYAQGPFQPTQFNTVCDDNNDGFALFFMQEITSEIIGNSTFYSVTHHLSQAEATNGTNAIVGDYTNVSNPQTIFARVITLPTGQVQIIPYNLTVNPTPVATPQTITSCDDNNDGFAIFDLSNVQNLYTNGQLNLTTTFYYTYNDANFESNPLMGFNYNNIYPFQETLYVRVENEITGCFNISTLQLVVENCQNPNCPSVTNLVFSDIVNNATTLSWLESGTATLWEVLIEYNGVSTASQVVSTNSITLNNVECNTFYTVSVRPKCSDTEYGNWITIYFDGPDCPQVGQPESYAACVDLNQQACFNLTDNDNNILGTLDPNLYTITYHASNSDAAVNSNTLASPYCVGVGNTPIYARVSKNDGTFYETVIFYLNVTTVNININFLEGLAQCDDDNNGSVVFDLTTVQSQINSTNTLSYFINLNDALSGLNPISNSNAFTVTVPSNQLTIYIKESIVGDCDIIHSFQLVASSVCNLASNCIQANSLCNALGMPFNNSINTNVTEPGANYGCLSTHPNPTWFYLPVSQSGTINLMVQQNNNINFNGVNQDVDYIVYGPFTSPNTPCYNQLTQNNIVSCSYSAAAIEYPTIPNALAGQYYLIMLTNFSNQPGFIRINELGTSSAQINCSGMRLNAFLDVNNNGVKDTGESDFPLGQFHYEKNNDGIVHDITAPTGVYNIYETNVSNTYDFNYTINSAYASLYTVTPTNFNDESIVAGGGMITYSFPITTVQSYNDAAVYLIPLSDPRPGFTYKNKIVYGNLGNQTISSGTITFVKDANVTISTISQAGTTTTSNGFTFDYSNLLPFEYRTIDVTMLVPTIPTVALGQLLTNSVSIEPITGDVVPSNNSNNLSQVVIGAYDPNDKMESRGSEILHASFTSEDYLYYTIRFENTGTASAINVRINDVLNSQLDPSTVRMIDASHPYILDQVDANLNWIFDNIQLPPSVANTDIGKGYVTFAIKPMPGYEVGDIIPNSASIYFDFNPPIITNTFNTEFTAPLANAIFTASNVIVYPNPANTIVEVSIQNANEMIESIKIIDMLGKNVIQINTLNANQKTIDISSLSKGIYMIEIATENKFNIQKKLIVK